MNLAEFFSVSGDTLTEFDGGFGDSLKFDVTCLRADTLKPLEQFIIVTKEKNVVGAMFPAYILKKYKLTQEGEFIDPDSSSDLEVEQTNITNRRWQRRPKNKVDIEDSTSYVFKCYKKITIKCCNKVLVKDMIVESDYEAFSKESNELSKSNFVPFLERTQAGKRYYFLITFCDTKLYYTPPKNANCGATLHNDRMSVFFKRYLVTCE